MNKRILPLLIVLTLCLASFYLPAAAAAPQVSAVYGGGRVTVTGAGFEAGRSYTVRVVDAAQSSIKAMGQADADGTGRIALSVTTGALKTVTDYSVYVNRPDGRLMGTASVTAGGSAGPGDDSGEESESDSGNTSGSDFTLPVVRTESGTSIVSVKTTATIDGSTGAALASVGADAFEALLTAWTKEAEASGRKPVLEILAEGAYQAPSLTVKIPGASLRKAAALTEASLQISSGMGCVTFDAKAVAAIGVSAGNGEVSLTVRKLDPEALPEEAGKAAEGRPLYDFTLLSGNIPLTTFGGGKVQISLPYDLREGEDENAVVIYSSDDAGNLQTVRGRYDGENRMARFLTEHFSVFMIGYNPVSFRDVAGTAWYERAVSFVAARGLDVSKNGLYAPDAPVSRGAFLVMAMKAYGIEPDSAATGHFSDTKDRSDSLYFATARRMGLAAGVGTNSYKPDEAISRQDMFTLLYRMLERVEELPESGGKGGRALESFRDAGSVAGYAREVLRLFTEAGILAGNGENLLPGQTATRAQAAQMLYMLLSR